MISALHFRADPACIADDKVLRSSGEERLECYLLTCRSNINLPAPDSWVVPVASGQPFNRRESLGSCRRVIPASHVAVRITRSRVTIQKPGIRESLKKPRWWCCRRCCKADRQIAGQTQVQKTINTIPNKHTRRRFIKTPAKLQNPDGSHPAGNHSVEVLRPLGFWKIVRIVGCAVFHGNILGCNKSPSVG